MLTPDWSKRAGFKAEGIQGSWHFRGLCVALAVAALATAALGGPTPGKAEEATPSARKTEADLKALKSEIAKVASQVRDDKAAKDRLARELRNAEMSVSE